MSSPKCKTNKQFKLQGDFGIVLEINQDSYQKLIKVSEKFTLYEQQSKLELFK